jgi:hypothetical protein
MVFDYITFQNLVTLVQREELISIADGPYYDQMVDNIIAEEEEEEEEEEERYKQMCKEKDLKIVIKEPKRKKK